MRLIDRARSTPPAAAARLATLLVLLAAVPAGAQSPLLDVDRPDASPVLDLFDDGGLVTRGEFGVGAIPSTGVGTRLMWYPGKAAFRAGTIDGQGPALWDDAQVGNYSTAFGIVPLASAPYAFAAGYLVEATNDGATALGYGTLASGFTSIAAGYQSEATGHSAAALGRETVASGDYGFASGLRSQATGPNTFAHGPDAVSSGLWSIAMGSEAAASSRGSVALGERTVASSAYSVALGGGAVASASGAVALGNAQVSGQNSLAMGPYVNVQAPYSVGLGWQVNVGPTHTGSFAFGDRVTATGVDANVVTGPRQFAVRATGGVHLYTSAFLATGAVLGPGSNSWASLSDVNAKENFVDLDQAYVLEAIDGMSIREWNYKENDDDVRHIGPTAQEFRAAFGLGSDPLRIETIDADGVALAAIQALIRENRALRARVAELEGMEDRVAALEADRERLAALEARLDALLAGSPSSEEDRR